MIKFEYHRINTILFLLNYQTAFFSSSPFVTCFTVQHFPVFDQKATPCEVSMALAPATSYSCHWQQRP